MNIVRIPQSSIAPLSHGHPWAYRDFHLEEPVGSFVQLADAQRKPVAWGLADEGPIAVRVLGRGEGPANPFVELADRLRRADAFRFRIAPPQTDCWRCVHAAGDGLPGLVIDRYGDLAVIRLYSKAWERHLEWLTRQVVSWGWASTVARRLGVGRVDGGEGLETLWGEPAPDHVIVNEHGMRLLVRPHVGQKTGLFLDQRTHRALVGGWSAGRRVANLFAYNGGFSVAAALGGAAHVTTVDLAADAIEDAKENFRLNGLDPDEHAFEVADVFAWRARQPVDLLIVDPPSLTHGKSSDGAAESAYRKLHARLGPMVVRDGLLATASCTARLDLQKWKRAVAAGLQNTGDWSWHWVSGEPLDHPASLVHVEAHYLKFALLRRR